MHLEVSKNMLLLYSRYLLRRLDCFDSSIEIKVIFMMKLNNAEDAVYI